jgi:hypothetical protein
MAGAIAGCVLVVDDDSSIRGLLSRHLQRRGMGGGGNHASGNGSAVFAASFRARRRASSRSVFCLRDYRFPSCAPSAPASASPLPPTHSSQNTRSSKLPALSLAPAAILPISYAKPLACIRSAPASSLFLLPPSSQTHNVPCERLVLSLSWPCLLLSDDSPRPV